MRYASVAGLEFSMDLLHAVLPRNIRPQLELLMQASDYFFVHHVTSVNATGVCNYLLAASQQDRDGADIPV